MKILFFGTPHFAVPTLQRLIESPHKIAGVITQPDKPKGRGRKLAPPPVKELALEHDLHVLQPRSVKKEDFHQEIAALDADAAVVVAYGKILPSAVLETPRHGCLNIHASLLPQYRGAAPIQWALANCEQKTGITIMQMDEGMDRGPIIAQQEIDILEDDDAISVSNMLSMVGAELMAQVLDDLEKNGDLAKEPQDDSQASMAPLIERDMARIDWGESAEKIICRVRGFLPWPKAFTSLNGKELKITAAEACDKAWVPATAFDERLPTGSLVEILKSRGFVVKCGGEEGLVLVTRVQPEGKPEMGAFDFYNGGGIGIGDLLGR